VKGEFGYYEFAVYQGSENGWRFFGVQKGKECYETENYRSMIYYNGATESSYGKVASDYNRQVRQSDKRLNKRSVQKGVLLESRALDRAIEIQSQAILSTYEASNPDLRKENDGEGMTKCMRRLPSTCKLIYP